MSTNEVFETTFLVLFADMSFLHEANRFVYVFYHHQNKIKEKNKNSTVEIEYSAYSSSCCTVEYVNNTNLFKLNIWIECQTHIPYDFYFLNILIFYTLHINAKKKQRQNVVFVFPTNNNMHQDVLSILMFYILQYL